METINFLADADSSQPFYIKESQCEYRFNNNGPFWHLFTPGATTEILFVNNDDFKYVMNLMGIGAVKFPDIRIITFEVMDNHLHIIIAGKKIRCFALFDFMKLRLNRYMKNSKRIVDLSGFNASLIPIDNLTALRNEIVYVNRNGYLASSQFTPYTYPWGAGYLFFNKISDYIHTVSYNSLTIREKFSICRSKDIELTENIRIVDNVIMPSSYCHVSEAEQYFIDAHQYFAFLSKKYEAYSEVAKRLKDTIFMSDAELYPAICHLCFKRYNINHPTLLSAAAKIEVAKLMHSEYNATNNQIRRILKLDNSYIESLFPPPRS